MDSTNGVEHRIERAVFETDRHRIVGDVTLPPEGYQSRFSDLLNREDLTFIPLVNVEISPLEGGDVERHDFVALSKTHIRIASTLESEPVGPLAARQALFVDSPDSPESR